jgi:hypothetical protein
MKVMKSPIPALIACFKLFGMASINFERKEVRDKRIKMIPVTKTAEKATVYEISWVPNTEYAKYAFNPIAGAMTIG